MRIPLIATKAFEFDGRHYAPGERFEAAPVEAAAHLYLRRAIDARGIDSRELAPDPHDDDLDLEDLDDGGANLDEDIPDTDATDEPPPEPPPPAAPKKKKRRTYKRRDMQPEK